MDTELGAKRIGLLHELLPAATRFAMLLEPMTPTAPINVTVARTAAAAIGLQVEFVNASTNREIDTAFASFAQKRIEALLLPNNLLFQNRRVQLATLAVRYAVPVISPIREFAEAGGLMNYGSNTNDVNRQAGIYAGRILKGEKPADLPVVRPTKFEFVINLHTAKLLGIAVPATLLATADEVIE